MKIITPPIKGTFLVFVRSWCFSPVKLVKNNFFFKKIIKNFVKQNIILILSKIMNI